MASRFCPGHANCTEERFGTSIRSAGNSMSINKGFFIECG